MECKYRGKKILITDTEEAYHCDGAMTRDLDPKSCDKGTARYDSLLGICRVAKPAPKGNGGAFTRLGEGRFA